MEPSKLKLMLVGHGRAGKDEAGEFLERITNLKFAGTTSKYLAKYVAEEQGVTEEEAYRTRHHAENRTLWYDTGNKLRRDNPSLLIQEALQHGDITGGVRDKEEVVACRNSTPIILVIWIENLWVPVDPTVKFSSRECDLVIQNNWGLLDFHNRLTRLAKCLGIFRQVDARGIKTPLNENGDFVVLNSTKNYLDTSCIYPVNSKPANQ